mmetsp:Transcript_21832/g.58839  ORF Transcript_21832/g.58839 Transcript_21832/m.58839 type:complete len:329 (-) Transcript_21832:300-1286(-)
MCPRGARWPGLSPRRGAPSATSSSPSEPSSHPAWASSHPRQASLTSAWQRPRLRARRRLGLPGSRRSSTSHRHSTPQPTALAAATRAAAVPARHPQVPQWARTAAALAGLPAEASKAESAVAVTLRATLDAVADAVARQPTVARGRAAGAEATIATREGAVAGAAKAVVKAAAEAVASAAAVAAAAAAPEAPLLCGGAVSGRGSAHGGCAHACWSWRPAADAHASRVWWLQPPPPLCAPPALAPALVAAAAPRALAAVVAGARWFGGGEGDSAATLPLSALALSRGSQARVGASRDWQRWRRARRGGGDEESGSGCWVLAVRARQALA